MRLSVPLMRSRIGRIRRSAASLKQQTSTNTLEEAFLALTGTSIREEQGSKVDQMRNMAKMFSGRR